MLGKLFSAAIDVVTFPVKVGEVVLAKAVGTDRQDLKKNCPMPTDATDKIKEILKEADED